VGRVATEEGAAIWGGEESDRGYQGGQATGGREGPANRGYREPQGGRATGGVLGGAESDREYQGGQATG